MTLDTLKALADIKGCMLSRLLGDVLDDYVELGLAEAEMESEVEAQTGVAIPVDGKPGLHLVS